MTTVGELKDMLKAFDDDREVIIPKDGEGSDFRPLEIAELSYMDPEGDHDVYNWEDIRGYSTAGDFKPVVVLWPAW